MWSDEKTVQAVTAYASLFVGLVLTVLFFYMVVSGQTDADIMIKVLTAIVAGGNIGKGLAPLATHAINARNNP